jgi:hypothetical protein
MSTEVAVFLITFIAIVTANAPWVTENLFFFIKREQEKSFLLRLGEWFVLYFVVGLLAAGLELQQNGMRHDQDWEFYVATFCLYLVFALPGFIYQYEFKRYLSRLENS